MLARISEGLIAEQRDLLIDDVPPHKRDQWKPVEGDKPSFGSRIEMMSGPIYIIEATRVLRQWTKTPRDLATVQAEFASRVDDAAEIIRLKYITAGSGMSMTYQEKRDQAEEIQAQGQPAIDALTAEEIKAAYPTIAASIGIEAATAWDVSQLVIAKAGAWADLSFEIETRRLAGKKAIDDAMTNVAVLAAYEAVDWTGL